MNFTEYVLGLTTGFGLGLCLLPLGYWVLWQPLGKLWRGWRLHIQTADDLERAVRREVDKRWRDLETARRMKIISLEVEERMTRERGAASQKRL
jgi:type II secretory pathway component PulM